MINETVKSDMTGRAFYVKVELHVHAVTCPGVWLCPNGEVALQIDTLDCRTESRRASPIFPLLFHERFTFSKVFGQKASLAELQRTLEQELLYAELVQWATPGGRSITLATFETNLADLLYPTPCFRGLLVGVDVDLLMEPTRCFPGIIAPKIEVSTKTVVEEVLDSCDTSMNKCYVVNPKTINSKQITCGPRKRPVKGIIRQRRVCHTRSKPRSQSCRPYRQRSCSMGDCPPCTSYQMGPQIHQCYHSMRKDFTCAHRSCFPKPAATCDNIHVTDNCPVCLRYNCYFSKSHDDSDTRKSVDNKQRYHRNLSNDREYCCCVNRLDSTSDTQEESMRLESKVRNLRKAREKLRAAEITADDVEECNPRFTRDHSSHGFYKNLEKFYKRMYKQAKLRAQEVND